MEHDELREIEAKLEILRDRAKAYQEFVSPPGMPPLLWQMAMLADAGFTILPRVTVPDPDQCFPELTVAMTEVDWTDEHYCLVGGEGFSVMRVPKHYHGHLLRPKPMRLVMAYCVPTSPVFNDIEHFVRRDLIVQHPAGLRWRSRIMVCVGSNADRSWP